MRLSLVISIFLSLLLCWNAPVMALPLTFAQVQPVQTLLNSNQENVTDLEELTRNQKLWNIQGVLDYSYRLTRSCFCIPDAREPVIIKVSNGTTSSVTAQSTGQPANPELFNRYDTIPKLFDVIRDAIARRADSINVQYNPTLGYPTQINIDYNRGIADEELFLTVENFTKSTNFTEANSFELSGGEVKVSYSSTSFSGVPLLNYRDNNINLNFSGQQIRVQKTELGQLITVTLESVSDRSTVTFTLILPLVNLNTGSETIRIKVPGITTTTRTTIAGPGPGAEKTYTTVNLRGTAKFIVS